ncbi:MAG: hypothetical protein M3O36_20825 [Myxococcota bacterium]|nr:hypothetical protein [Myxococcota bacterium]
MIDPCSLSPRRRFGTQKALVVGRGASVVTLAVSVCISCGTTGTAADKAKAPVTRVETLDHEACSESGKRLELLDTNNDNRPDIRRVLDPSTGHEVCRIVDLNHDGKVDLYEYFNAEGSVRRREFCYDDSAAVNAIELYERGTLVQRKYDTTGHQRIDTWDWFDGSLPRDAKSGLPAHPSRRERDTGGDGAIDQWWTWEGDTVTIATDHNGDGKPDLNSTIVLGVDDAGPAPSPGASDAGALAPRSASEGGSEGATTDSAGARGKS